MPTRTLLCTLLATLLLGCGGESVETRELREAVRRTTGLQETPTVAFRFPASGGDVRLYRLPDLEEVAWRFRTPDLVAERLIGFSDDGDRIYVVTPGHQLVTLDLNSGRARLADSNVVAAGLSPAGDAFYARRDSGLLALDGRTPQAWVPAFREPVMAIRGMVRERMLVVTGGPRDRALAVVQRSGTDVTSRPLPDGDLAFSPWGDQVAVATDSGIVVIDPLRHGEDRFRALDQRPAAVAFSASGHRLWVSVVGGDVIELDRFGLEPLSERAVAVGLGRLRAGPRGHVLLVEGAGSESVWVVPLQDTTAAVQLAAGWADDLPLVTLDGVILLRVGNDLVARALDGAAELGRVPGGGHDRWLTAPWDPRRPALQLANETRERADTTAQELYVQVSSTTNLDWAEDLARDLRVAGVRTRVLPPGMGEEMYRVVVGPFTTRDEAEAAGRLLGMPYWIFTDTRDTTGTAVP